MNPRIYVGALDEATFTMSEAENSSYPLSNLSTYNASDQWRSSATTDGQTLKIDFGSARPRNFCIIENHNFSGLTTVSLQAADSSDYATNLTTVVTSLVGSANSPLKFEFTAVSKRYWRILFTTLGGTAPQLGQIFIDQKVEFSQSFDFGFRPKNEDFESVVRKVAMSGLERAAKTYSGRLRFEMGWNNVNNTTLELLRWWMQKVSGGFAPFWYFDELEYSFYVRCGKNFNPATVNAYKINDIATITLQSVSTNQNPYTMQTAAMAVDLDGSTEYASKASPVNLDMNGSELTVNGGFEVGDTSSWVHSRNGGTPGTFAVDSGTKHFGTYSGKITTAATEEYPLIHQYPNSAFIPTTIGKKYTIEIWINVNGTTDVPTIWIGTGTYPNDRNYVDHQLTAGEADGTWRKFTYNITAIGATLRVAFVFNNNNCTGGAIAYVDDVTVTEAYDVTILAWVKSSSTSTQSIVQKNIPDGGSASRESYQLYATAATFELYIQTNGIQGTSISGARTPDSSWRLVAVTLDRTANGILYVDAIAGSPIDISSVGKVNQAGAEYVGANSASQYLVGQIGEAQIIRGYAMTAAQILQIYNTTGILKAYDSTNFPGAVVVAHYRWKGTSDTDFLKDETGYNNLTGTNVTQVLDQATADYRIAEL